ncbi:MAG: hypothetical protein FJZ56_00325 [Chlamydiae bacterium]|nr:hypothetical protein [Chlamydiota bacterium]
MKKVLVTLCSSIFYLSALTAGMYEAIEVKVIDADTIDITLERGENGVFTTLMQALTLGRMSEHLVLQDESKAAIHFLVKEESVELIMEKAKQVLAGFGKNPISQEELSEAKRWLHDYLFIAYEELNIELRQIYQWLSSLQAPKKLSKRLAMRPLELGSSTFEFNVAKADQENIGKLLYAMSEYSYWQLLWKQKEVNALGDSVRHVPPLQFLVICTGSEKLKGWMQNMQKSTLKWRAFMNGLSEGLAREKEAGRLSDELEGFAELLGKLELLKDLEQAALRNNWNGFVDILIN